MDFVLEKMVWCEDARKALVSTCYDDGDDKTLEGNVKTGKCELFRVNGTSWLVTEIMGGTLFIWCFQGRNSLELLEKLRECAKNMGLREVSFFTRHRAAPRMLRRFFPCARPTEIYGETQYTIEAV